MILHVGCCLGWSWNKFRCRHWQHIWRHSACNTHDDLSLSVRIPDHPHQNKTISGITMWPEWASQHITGLLRQLVFPLFRHHYWSIFSCVKLLLFTTCWLWLTSGSRFSHRREELVLGQLSVDIWHSDRWHLFTKQQPTPHTKMSTPKKPSILSQSEGCPAGWVRDIVIILRDKTILISYRRSNAPDNDGENDAAVQDGVNVLADAGNN